ncbi:MAG: putative lipid II flippase FtsW [Deltaproteobacteria bacterium]|nr:putative lipid II flippase FtsW [Deltaproteobacteria bacterium]
MLPSALRLQRRILSLVILFLFVGQIMLFSATGVLALEKYGSEFYFLIRQALCAALGVILMLILSKIRYQIWNKLVYPLIGIQIVLVALTVFSGHGHQAQGASRWLKFGMFSFQPGELAKITVAIFVAHYLTLSRSTRLSAKRKIIEILCFVTLILLIFKQPDLGSTVLLLGLALGAFFIAGARPALIAGGIGIGSILLVLALLQADYRRRRLMAFLNPWADPQGNGFQAIQSFLSFHSGKLFGVGLGNGNSKLFFLPEVHTDFIFSLIGEELGFVGACILLILFAYFAYCLFKVALKAPDSFGSYLAFGLAFILVAQIAINVGGVTGIIPVKGLPLPFISWGRSAVIVNLAMVGILLNIVRQSGIIEKNNGPH